MKSWLKQFTTEDWIIVFVGVVVLALACIFPAAMPSMPKNFFHQQTGSMPSICSASSFF